jgi:hypothetical protein
MAERIPPSTALRVAFKAYLSSDGFSPATGKTIPVVISKNGAAFGNPSAGATTATEIALGWYYVDLSTTDTGTAGPLIVRGTESTMDPAEVLYHVVDDKTGLRLSAAGVDDLWDDVVDGTTTARQSLRLTNAVLGGKLAGGGTGTEVIRDLADTKDRVTATVDASGNRTAVVRDLS